MRSGPRPDACDSLPVRPAGRTPPIARDRRGWPARLPSPGHGQPVQLRYQTELTAEEHAGREEWRNATVPPCLKGRCRHRCGLMRHGTCGRKTPVPMRVARFCCPGCRTTISRLPDFAAARRRGSLQEIEDDMIVLAGSPSRWAAARRLFPHRDELSNAIRGLRCAFAAVSAFLAAVVTLRPDLFRGCPAELPAMRAARHPGQTQSRRARLLESSGLIGTNLACGIQEFSTVFSVAARSSPTIGCRRSASPIAEAPVYTPVAKRVPTVVPERSLRVSRWKVMQRKTATAKTCCRLIGDDSRPLEVRTSRTT